MIKRKLVIDLKPTQILVLGFLLLTMFGKVVIITLIQIGGIGFMTITTTLFILLGKKIGLKERLIIQEALNQYTISGMVRLSRNIILGTFIIEGLGAIFLTFNFLPEYGSDAVFMGIFHSISAFCNAGFDIINGDSLTPYISNVVVNITVMSLIIFGGLGFTVWLDLLQTTKERLKYKWRSITWFRKLSLHTKIVLVMTTGLILIGAIFFFLLEYSNPGTLGDLSIKEKILGSFFQSVTTRTAGFNTIPQENMSFASQFMTIMMMFIGGSPGGTAGGVKTVTMGVIFLAVVSVVRAKDDVEVYGRRISWDIIKRALAVVVISITLVFLVTMSLTLTESGSFIEILFEAVSAFATVGLTVGATAKLTVIGKLIISVAMFIGRLGPVTIAVAITMRSNKKSKVMEKYPEEKVMVG
jgi:trk system potassium uptake protein TrkH